MEYRKPLFFLLLIIFIAGCVYLYFLTAPSVPIPSTTPVATTSTTATVVPGQSTQVIIPLTDQVPNQAKTPDALTADFYSWYLQGLMSDQKFTVSDQFKSAIGGWLTQDFISNWNTLIEKTGSDPVLLAQDYQGSWVSNIQTTILNQTSTASTILITLGTPVEEHKLTVHLERMNDAWRISSVAPSSIN